jgi:uncharacterized protein involved in response to NO
MGFTPVAEQAFSVSSRCPDRAQAARKRRALALCIAGATVIPLKPIAAGPPAPMRGAGRTHHRSGPPRLRRLLDAPHRLGFFAGALLLASAALWWGAALTLRAAAVPVPWAVSPSTAHALVMVFAFMPLFFVGFLYTAGPRWLQLPPVSARALLVPVIAMVAGWLVAALGFHVSAQLAALGLAAVALGFGLLSGRFGLLVAQSRAADRDHAAIVLIGCVVLAFALWGAAVGVAMERDTAVRSAAQVGLWGGAGLVFASVAHRMIPFFTAAAVPALDAWRPRALLMILVLLIGVQAPFAAADVVVVGAAPFAWSALRAVIELAGGALLVWLAVRWGLVQSLRVRLLAMLHMGFFWLGVAFVLGGVSHALQAASDGALSLGLAPLHAFTIGYLGSTLLAMATRVVCGHSGRALVADRWAWAIFWALQAAVMLRVLAALWPSASTPLTLLAAQFFVASAGAWTLRYGRWLLQPRADGQTG